MANDSVKKPTLCWSCARATGFCPWSEAENMRPVPGWTAKETTISINEVCIKSYCVMACPLYVADSTPNGQAHLKDAKKIRNDVYENYSDYIVDSNTSNRHSGRAAG